MFAKISIALLILMSITSCALSTSAIRDWCKEDHVITVSKFDNLTAGTERQILTHNEVGTVVCGWHKGLIYAAR